MNELFDPSETVVELKTTDDALVYEKLLQSDLQKTVKGIRNDCILLKLHRDEIPGVLKQLVQMELGILSFNSRHSLEDYFLSLTTGKEYVDLTAH